MAITDLNEFQIISGTFSVIFVVISLIIGASILRKYLSKKEKTFITVGLTWIFISSPWWPRSIDFILRIFFDSFLSEFAYLFLGIAFIPVALMCWIYSFCVFVYPNYKSKILTVFILIFIVYEFFLLLFLFTNPKLIGFVDGFYAEFSLFTISYQFFAIITFLITGILFTRESLKSMDQRIRWKGRFLLIAFISFTISALYESAAPLTTLSLALIRILLISSALEYYLGFFLPEFISKRLIKET
ncbi:MAG: hypothetical protein GF383_08330 [Candidatus Lokiarchaeota archaeon]|nr:hypothetical protein [Candidatus Lokiarchaeota archaeon]MBD3340358.1 hypothetical protein [Candidatus Lokiarchaeota archaeon]